MYYGEYDYKYSSTTHKACPIAKPISDIADEIVKHFSDIELNSCLVTYYADGKQHCPPHSDDEIFIDPMSKL